MRITYAILLLLSTFSSGASQSLTASFKTYESLPDWFNKQLYIREYGTFIINENMNPFYLEADFNGMGMLDIAVCIQEPNTNKKGILIHHREDRTFYILGAGKLFNKWDDFSWMEIWKVYRHKSAERTLFTESFDIGGSETVELTNVAIEISKSESSSNIITWDGEQYIWVHTGD